MKYTIAVFLFFSISEIGCTQPKNDTIYKAYLAVQNEEIAFHSIERIQLPKAKDFQGSYHFGESEGESILSIIFSNGQLYAKTEYSIWEKQGWKAKTERVHIEYDNGKIIIKEEDSKMEYFLYKCINNSNLFLKKGTKGIGFSFNETDGNQLDQYIQFNERSEMITKGIYPEASFVKLVKKDLEKYSKEQLKIIRNEVFARNAYSFKKGGAMDKYFSQKQWYNTMKKTENPKLSDIEKHNINLISKLEKS